MGLLPFLLYIIAWAEKEREVNGGEMGLLAEKRRGESASDYSASSAGLSRSPFYFQLSDS